MTTQQEERMYELMGKEEITQQEGAELERLVDEMCFDIDKEIADIGM